MEEDAKMRLHHSGSLHITVGKILLMVYIGLSRNEKQMLLLY